MEKTIKIMKTILLQSVNGHMFSSDLGKVPESALRTNSALRLFLSDHARTNFGPREGRDWRIAQNDRNCLVPLYAVSVPHGDTITIE